MTHMKTTALVLALWTAACGSDGDNPDIPVQNLAVVVAGDFTPGSPGVMSALDLDTMEIEQQIAPNGAIAEEPMLRRVGGELFVVNRAAGNNITILDATTFELIEQLATGEGTNPQDVAVVGNRLFVPAQLTAGVVVIERGTGATSLIDLSTLDVADGEPDCVSAFAVGSKVFVACGKLDQFVANEPGTIVVIDTANGDAVSTFEMENKNPLGAFEQRPDTGELVIATVPDFTDFSTGCVERIDTRASTPTSLGCGVTNLELGGYASRIAFQSIDGAVIQWMVAASLDENFSPQGNLQGIDLTNDTLIGPVSAGTQVLVDVAVCRDQSTIIVADASLATNGLRAYSNEIEVTTEALAIGLKPGSFHGIDCY
jgi:hypothetical protein